MEYFLFRSNAIGTILVNTEILRCGDMTFLRKLRATTTAWWENRLFFIVNSAISNAYLLRVVYTSFLFESRGG